MRCRLTKKKTYTHTKINKIEGARLKRCKQLKRSGQHRRFSCQRTEGFGFAMVTMSERRREEEEEKERRRGGEEEK